MGRYSPLPFSPGYNFKAFKAFTYGGLDYINGDDFPKAGQEKPGERLLEKLYTQRRIVPVDPRDPAASVFGNKHGEKHAKRPAEMVVATETVETVAEPVVEPVAEGAGEQPPVDNDHVEDGAVEFTPEEIADYANSTALPGSEPAADAVEAAPAADAPETVETAPAAAPEPAAGLKKVHKGFGKYDVLDAAGTVLASGLSQADAEAMIA